MKFILFFLLAMLSISELFLILLSFYSGKAIKRIFLNAIIGISAIILINITTKWTGVHIPVNVYSIAGTCAFSLPAVIGLLLLQIIFI